MKRFLLVCFMFVVSNSLLRADLILDITGTPGDGFTTFSFSFIDSGTVADFPGTIRTNSANTFDSEDTFTFVDGFNEPIEGLSNSSISNQVFALTGNASITVGGVTENITGIFLNYIPPPGPGILIVNQFGIRTENELSYLEDENTIWSGEGTISLDISNFIDAQGYSDDFPLFADGLSEIQIEIAVPVPEPSTYAMLALSGIAGLIYYRRKQKLQTTSST